MSPVPSRETLIEEYGEPDDIAQDPSNRSNRERADWALDAVNAFAKRSHTRPDEQHYELDELDDGGTGQGVAIELLGDLVCDLMHLAILCSLDPDDVIETGRQHFLREVGMGYDA